ncbi:MAG: branched-chain amino acid ABC transporter permease [Rhizobiales bacterium]|uniref:branched-chain amino acid ABC transporter permease n=1 Tax=Xanthobacter autotrophicus TaxID=280 RepID=UPI001ACD693D|nr:branched-chain amino acid ABC transporter permease [Xanthobacter autotrophicus]MBN8917031.1 branched-chain amino acid ABC transporter permease [Hyphomicrobiales bacterium]UDQ87717.1 branched-chain amino acid ABC transporter permease [Xanthobacter autotrophicus]
MISYLVTVVILVAIAALVGLALNLQWGLAGLVNFGVAGFVALGAYTLAISAPHVGWLAGLALSAAVCAGLSMLLSLLTIRLEENYLAIVTIGFAEIVRILLLNLGDLTGGALGIADIPRPFAGITPAGWGDAVILAFALGLVVIVFAFSEALVRSPFGRALRAVRDDATAAAALGKPVLALRVRAFAIGGAIMGLAGALHAFFLTYIDPSQFTPIITAYAFMAVIAGGRGSNLGLVLGAGSIMLILEATRFLKDVIPGVDGVQLSALRLGMIGVGIVLLLILRPEGLVSEPKRRFADFFPPESEKA